MYQYHLLHSLSIVSKILALIFVVVMSSIRQRRGETGILRQSLPIWVGLLLMLMGSLLQGGHHPDAGTLVDFTGMIVLLVGVFRLRQWQKANKPGT